MKKYSTDWYWYYTINSVLVILILFPIYWTFISSVKKPHELITSEPTFYPHTWTWQYYQNIWNSGITGDGWIDKREDNVKKFDYDTHSSILEKDILFYP